MRLYPLCPAALAVLLAGLGSPARAQGIPFGGPAYQPPVNPIVNITRQGAPPGLNYYNIVQPQLQFQASISQLQQQTTQLQAAATAVGPGATLTSGHPVFYGNLTHYYSTRGLAGVGAGAGAGAGAAGFQVGTGAVGGTSQGRPGQVPNPAAPAFPGTGGVR
jgi:hypothetical protein